jgi:hypothetical protein
MHAATAHKLRPKPLRSLVAWRACNCLRTLSAVLFCRTVMLAVPTSPLVLNLTPSLVALICTVGNKQQGGKTPTHCISRMRNLTLVSALNHACYAGPQSADA